MSFPMTDILDFSSAEINVVVNAFIDWMDADGFTVYRDYGRTVFIDGFAAWVAAKRTKELSNA
jgi:hypothetical protein